jgi:hypothetical protein
VRKYRGLLVVWDNEKKKWFLRRLFDRPQDEQNPPEGSIGLSDSEEPNVSSVAEDTHEEDDSEGHSNLDEIMSNDEPVLTPVAPTTTQPCPQGNRAGRGTTAGEAHGGRGRGRGRASGRGLFHPNH